MKKIWISSFFAVLTVFAATSFAADEDMVLVQRKGANEPLNLTSASGHNTQANNDSTASAIRISGLILVALGCCIGGVVLYFKRRSAAKTGTKQSARLSIQERLSFGPNREFILLKACDRILVVAAQNGQAVLLTDMASEEPAASTPAAQLAEESPLTYETVLSRATRRLDTARAQASSAPQAQSWPELEGVMR